MFGHTKYGVWNKGIRAVCKIELYGKGPKVPRKTVARYNYIHDV